MVKNIGFIGLGIMGKPMVRNLLKAGFAVTVFDVVADAVQAMADEGAVAAQSPKARTYRKSPISPASRPWANRWERCPSI